MGLLMVYPGLLGLWMPYLKAWQPFWGLIVGA